MFSPDHSIKQEKAKIFSSKISAALLLLLSIFSVLNTYFLKLKSENVASYAQTVPAPEGILQFASGFENNVQISQDGRSIVGADLSVPTANNDWAKLSSYIPWALYQSSNLQGGKMEIITDPNNPNNHLLHFFNSDKVTSGTSTVSRTQYALKQEYDWTDTGGPNLFSQQFTRFKILIPDTITKIYSDSESSDWYMIWESHAWVSENTRYGIYLHKHSNSNQWYFEMRQQRPEGGTILWQNSDQFNIPVPFGTWFTLDIFLKYHETDGEFFAAIQPISGQRQILGDYKGQTKFDTKLHDLMPFKLYHAGTIIDKVKALGYDGTHQYYDDFEMWSDFPPGYFETSSPTPVQSSPTPSTTPIETPIPTSTPTLTLTPAPTSPPTSTPVPVTELLLNNGFEIDANGDSRPDNWTSNSKFTRSSAVVNSGSYSGRHYSKSNGNYLIDQTVNGIVTNASYNFSGFTNIPSTTDTFTFKIALVWKNSAGTTLRTDTLGSFSAATNGWMQVNSTKVAPSTAASVIIRMDNTSVKGPIYVDSFSLKKL